MKCACGKGEEFMNRGACKQCLFQIAHLQTYSYNKPQDMKRYLELVKDLLTPTSSVGKDLKGD